MSHSSFATLPGAGRLASCLSDRFLHLILLPTEACNFRCVYCYEEFKYRQMEPWVVEGVKGLLSRRAPGLSDLTLSWFGGEPLLARGVIETIMLHAGELRRVHPSMQLRSNATTNGYLLTREVFDHLLALGVSEYQISFDGPRACHDRKRVLAGGKGTFDRIWGNLLAIRDAPGEFTITVRVHVDEENASEIPAFIDEYAESFGTNRHFELFIRGLARLGGPNDSKLKVFERGEGEKVFEGLRGLARSRGARLMGLEPDHAVCYAARGNSFVIRSNGRINKCTVALEHPNNQVGRIREDGTVELAVPKLRMWMRGLESGSAEELKCPMRGYADPIPLVPAGGAITLQRGSGGGSSPPVECEKAVIA
jgi:uncharacterized protein